MVSVVVVMAFNYVHVLTNINFGSMGINAQRMKINPVIYSPLGKQYCLISSQILIVSKSNSCGSIDDRFMHLSGYTLLLCRLACGLP